MQKQLTLVSINLVSLFCTLSVIGSAEGYAEREYAPLQRLCTAVEPGCRSDEMMYKHKQYKYEVVLRRGDIEKQKASAVINPYAPGQGLARASEALYKSGGIKFLERLRNFHAGNKERFDLLLQEPGNYLMLPADVIPLSRKLAFSNMILMNIPLAIDEGNESDVLQALCKKLSHIFVHELSPRFSKVFLSEATVVLPALGHDPLFTGYKGVQVAKRFLSSVVAILLHLHSSGSSSLNRVMFVVDNEEAFSDYQTAFKEYFKDEGANFLASGQASPELG